MELFESTEGIIVFSLVSLLVGCWILYAVIKVAIKDAHKEMQQTNHNLPKPLSPPIWNEVQSALQNKYEKGEITLEQYNEEWKKL